jgi:ABC-2 type transport system permease protein
MCSAITLMIMREWRRVFMEPSRLFGILLQPLIFLLVFGLGFNSSFSLSHAPNITYGAYFFPGILALVVLFSSIYSCLTLVEDKARGFFRYAAAGPGGLMGALWGKTLATCSLGFTQSLLFLPLVIFLNVKSDISWLAVITLLFLGSLAFSILGILFAWVSPSASAFHALMSVILIPMWLLSGAMFPLDHSYLKIMTYVNPMAFLVATLRGSLLDVDNSGVFNVAMLLVFSFLAAMILLITAKRKPIE